MISSVFVARRYLAAFITGNVLALWLGLAALAPAATPPPINPQPPDGSVNRNAKTQLSWALGEINLIVNGGFEAGGIQNGWTTLASTFGGFQNQNGTFNPFGPEGAVQPLSGTNCVTLQSVFFNNNPSTYILAQTVAIPEDVESVTLRWSDIINNYTPDGTFDNNEPPHRYQVVVVNTNETDGAIAFTTGPGYPPFNPWTKHTFDITRLKGQNVNVYFIAQLSLPSPNGDFGGALAVHIDNVELAVRGGSTLVTNEVYLGTSPNLTTADLQGITLDTRWTLPDLNPNTTYYWRIVTRSGFTANASPIWQFQTSPLGAPTRFAFDAIPSPQTPGITFPISITAKDDHDFTISSFNGTANLTASSLQAGAPHTLLDDQPYTALANYDGGTIGYSFTPSSDLIVSAFRTYSGQKASLWTDGGILLATEPISTAAGSWQETSLTTPVTLLAGRTYRLGVYSPALTTHSARFDAPSTFAHGLLKQSYDGQGDGFPTQSHPAQWWYLDLVYSVPTAAPLTVVPATTGNFINGVWTGNITLQGQGANIQIKARTSNGLTLGVGNFLDLAEIDDSDFDGMPDDWETQYQLNPNDPTDAALDADEDGQSNLDEYRAGTNPRDAGSVFRWTAIARNGDDVVVSFASVSGKSYRVERTDSLVNPVWSAVSNSVAGTGTVLEITDAGAVARGTGFYRVVLE